MKFTNSVIASLLMAVVSATNDSKVVNDVQETTKFLFEVCRHGARASSKIFPLTVDDPYDNFAVPQALT